MSPLWGRVPEVEKPGNKGNELLARGVFNILSGPLGCTPGALVGRELLGDLSCLKLLELRLAEQATVDDTTRSLYTTLRRLRAALWQVSFSYLHIHIRPSCLLEHGLCQSTHTHTHTRLMALFPGEPVPERQNQSGFY